MKILGISANDWIAGLFAILIGVFALFESSGYSMGSTRDMGPGFFPVMLGVLMVVFGIGVIAIEGRRKIDHEKDTAGIRPIIMVTLGLLLFAQLIDRFGMWPALFAACFVSALADSKMKLYKAGIIAFCIATASAVVFVYALGLQVGVFK